MNTQIHAYRDIPGICDKLRAITHGAAEIDRLDRANPPDETPAGIGSPPQFPDGTPIPKDHHSHPDNRE